MSFFFGGNDNAVPVLVKDIERLLRGGRHSDGATDDDDGGGDDDDDVDDDGLVSVVTVA